MCITYVESVYTSSNKEKKNIFLPFLFKLQLVSYKRFLECKLHTPMETIYLSLVHTGSWGSLFHEIPGNLYVCHIAWLKVAVFGLSLEKTPHHLWILFYIPPPNIFVSDEHCFRQAEMRFTPTPPSPRSLTIYS